MDWQAANAAIEIQKEEKSLASTKKLMTEKIVEVVLGLYLEGKYFECLNVLENVGSELDNNDERIKMVRASCWTFLGMNLEEAVNLLHEIIAANPDNPQAFYALGLNFYMKGELEMCLEPFTLALKLFSCSINKDSIERVQVYRETALKALNLICEAHCEILKADFVKAIASLTNASMVDPNNVAFNKRIFDLSNAIMLNQITKNNNEAMRRTSLESALNHVEFLIKLNHLRDAEKVLPGSESSARCWLLRGILKYKFGVLKQSIVCFRTALSIDPSLDDAKDLLVRARNFVELMGGATTKMRENHYEASIAMLTLAAQIDTDNKRVTAGCYLQLAYCKFTMGNTDDAFNDFLSFEANEKEHERLE